MENINMRKQVAAEIFNLDKVLVKHMSRLEREVQEAKNTRKNKAEEGSEDKTEDEEQVGKENIDSNRCYETVKEKLEMEVREQQGLKPVVQQEKSLKISQQSPMRTKNMSRLERAKLKPLEAFSSEEGNMLDSLDAIIIKPVHRLEREKLKASAWGIVFQKNQNKQGAFASDSEGLDKVLVKHVSRLEKEKVSWVGEEEVMKMKDHSMNFETSVDGLDQTVKRPFGPEKEKVVVLKSGDQTRHFEVRCKAMARELQDAWGGFSLGNSVRPHISGLGRDKVSFDKFCSSFSPRKAIGGSLVIGAVMGKGSRMVVGCDSRLHDEKKDKPTTFIDDDGKLKEYVANKLHVTPHFVFAAVGVFYIADLIFCDLCHVVKKFEETRTIDMFTISCIISSKIEEMRRNSKYAKFLSDTELLVVALEDGKLVMKKFTERSSEEIATVVSIGCDSGIKDYLRKAYNSYFLRMFDEENLEFSEPIYEAMKAANQGDISVGGNYNECVITVVENEGIKKLVTELKDPRVIDWYQPMQVEDPAQSSHHLADTYVGDESS